MSTASDRLREIDRAATPAISRARSRSVASSITTLLRRNSHAHSAGVGLSSIAVVGAYDTLDVAFAASLEKRIEQACFNLANDHAAAEKQRADDAERELAEIDTALDSVTKCVAPTRAQRIRDSFEHEALVTDAGVFDATKAEQSVRAQCTLWMGAAKLAAEERDAKAKRADALEARLRENHRSARKLLCRVCKAGRYRCGVGPCVHAWKIIDRVDAFGKALREGVGDGE